MTRTKKRIYFWGGFLSNWAFVPDGIKVQDEDGSIKTFPTSEHVFMWLKASCFNERWIMNLIEIADTPKLAKSLGRKIKTFDETIWNEKREECMLLALRYKAAAWPGFREFVKNETRDFVEASPYDKIWGIGMDEETAAKEDNPDNWNGLNLLGKSLGRLRDELLANEL